LCSVAGIASPFNRARSSLFAPLIAAEYALLNDKAMPATKRPNNPNLPWAISGGRTTGDCTGGSTFWGQDNRGLHRWVHLLGACRKLVADHDVGVGALRKRCPRDSRCSSLRITFPQHPSPLGHFWGQDNRGLHRWVHLLGACRKLVADHDGRPWLGSGH
jgi:hypothetical protein